jgi:hypothetical protein
MDRGIAYFAIGRAFVQEAQASAATVRDQMGQIPIAITTDCDVDRTLFDVVLRPDGVGTTPRQRIYAVSASPFDRTIALDTDTFLTRPLWELFELLDEFDLAMAVDPRYRVTEQNELDGVPAAYPRWNAGVIAFRRSAETSALIQAWARTYDEMKRFPDQPSLRVAAYRSSARIAPLPVAYNCRLPYPSVARGIVKILHGRPAEIEAVRHRINAAQGIRAFVPRRFRRNTTFFGDLKTVRSLRRRLPRLLNRLGWN